MLKTTDDCHCENCLYFNENEIPADCLKGKGKIAFHHPICSDFIRREGKVEDGKRQIR
jgi:hypothetical protein